MANTARNVCAVCGKKIFRQDDPLSCAKCIKPVHIACVGVDVDKYVQMSRNDEIKLWTCGTCEIITSDLDIDESGDTVGKQTSAVSGHDGIQVNNCDVTIKTVNSENLPDATSSDNDILRRLDEILHCVNKCMPCNCEDLLEQLRVENTELKVMLKNQTATIKAQSVIIQALRDEVRSKFAEIKASFKEDKNSKGSTTNTSRVQKPASYRDVCSDKNKTRSPDRPKETSPEMSLPGTKGVLNKIVSSPNTEEESSRNVAADKMGPQKNRNYKHMPDNDKTENTDADVEGGVLGTPPLPTPLGDSDAAPFTVVKRYRGKQNKLVGSNTASASSAFTGAERRLWLYVGRTSEGTAEQAVLGHMREKYPDDEFTATKLAFKGKYPSFKVGAPLRLKEDLQNPDFWPSGVIVRRFNFKAPVFQLESQPTTSR